MSKSVAATAAAVADNVALAEGVAVVICNGTLSAADIAF